MNEIPIAWEIYRGEICARLLVWEQSGRRNGDGGTLTDFAWAFATEVHNRGGGLVFLDFSERRQRCYLLDGFVDWLKVLADETRRANKV